jgi:hypothetical protein
LIIKIKKGYIMSCGIQSIAIIPEIGTVVNQGQEFKARVKVKNTNPWVLSECKLLVTATTNCEAYLKGVTSFNLNDINAGVTDTIEIPLTANGSSVGAASVTISFESVLDDTHYYSDVMGAGCWDVVNPSPLTCVNSKTEDFDVVAE